MVLFIYLNLFGVLYSMLYSQSDIYTSIYQQLILRFLIQKMENEMQELNELNAIEQLLNLDSSQMLQNPLEEHPFSFKENPEQRMLITIRDQRNKSVNRQQRKSSKIKTESSCLQTIQSIQIHSQPVCKENKQNLKKILQKLQKQDQNPHKNNQKTNYKKYNLEQQAKQTHQINLQNKDINKFTTKTLPILDHLDYLCLKKYLFQQGIVNGHLESINNTPIANGLSNISYTQILNREDLLQNKIKNKVRERSQNLLNTLQNPPKKNQKQLQEEIPSKGNSNRLFLQRKNATLSLREYQKTSQIQSKELVSNTNRTTSIQQLLQKNKQDAQYSHTSNYRRKGNQNLREKSLTSLVKNENSLPVHNKNSIFSRKNSRILLQNILF